MLSFGSDPVLQDSKLREVRATNSSVVELVEQLLKRNPSERISAEGLIEKLEQKLDKTAAATERDEASRITRKRRETVRRASAVSGKEEQARTAAPIEASQE